VEEPAVGRSKKNARRQHAWLVFEDESGVSQQPVVRRTWAPRGETPILTHTGGNWKRLSIAGALAFRWDGRRSRFFFQTHAGSYTDAVLIPFVQTLKRHFHGRRLILIWDGLGGHKSRRMLTYLRRQRSWLTVERLRLLAVPARAARSTEVVPVNVIVAVCFPNASIHPRDPRVKLETVPEMHPPGLPITGVPVSSEQTATLLRLLGCSPET
jgi:hypothetical protein